MRRTFLLLALNILTLPFVCDVLMKTAGVLLLSLFVITIIIIIIIITSSRDVQYGEAVLSRLLLPRSGFLPRQEGLAPSEHQPQTAAQPVSHVGEQPQGSKIQTSQDLWVILELHAPS